MSTLAISFRRLIAIGRAALLSAPSSTATVRAFHIIFCGTQSYTLALYTQKRTPKQSPSYRLRVGARVRVRRRTRVRLYVTVAVRRAPCGRRTAVQTSCAPLRGLVNRRGRAALALRIDRRWEGSERGNRRVRVRGVLRTAI